MSANKLKSCILHIGTEKTGTTTLQEFLALNRETFLCDGFLVPTSLHEGRSDHTFLTTYSLDISNLKDDLRAWRQIRNVEGVVRHREHIIEALSKEVSAAASRRNVTTVLFSNEHCHSRLIMVEEISRLKSLLENYAEEFTVIVYLRPQHEVLVSLYDTALKAGHSDIDILPESMPDQPAWIPRGYFDYASLLERWSSVFGKDRMQVRIFDKLELVNGSIVDDFLELIGCIPDKFIMPSSRNVSMDASCQEVLNFINRYQKKFPKILSEDMRRGLIYTLEQISNGHGLRPSQQDAARFFSSFEKGNCRVSRLFLKDREQLFTPDFSEFPVISTKQRAWRFLPLAFLRVLFNYIFYKTRRIVHGTASVGRAGRSHSQR